MLSGIRGSRPQPFGDVPVVCGQRRRPLNLHCRVRIQSKDTEVQVYFLLSSLKTPQPIHFTPWSLDMFIRVPFQLPGEHTALQPFRRIELIVNITRSTRYIFTLEASEACEDEEHCPRPQHGNNVLILRGEKYDMSLYQAGLETARQAARLAKLTLQHFRN